MKRYLAVILFVCAFSRVAIVNGQLNQVISEEISHDGTIPELVGFSTYRLFAQVENPTDFVTIVSGGELCDVSICSSGDWFNSPFAGNSGSNNNSSFWDMVPAARWDTYFTIGYSSSTTLGIPSAEDADGDQYEGDTPTPSFSGVNAIGDWISTFDEALAGSCIVDIAGSTGGGWFALNGDLNGYGVGVNNSVLLGQFTTNGEFSYALNVSIISQFGGGPYYHCNAGAPGLTSAANCTDSEACNYNPNAVVDDGSCLYAGDECNDYNAETGLDVYQDDCSCLGVVIGCTDTSAVNYSEVAVEDDGSCCYDNSIEVILRDSYGDGGATFSISDYTDALVLEGNLELGYGPELHTYCTASGCFYFELEEVEFAGEVSAELIINGEVVYTHEEEGSFDIYPLLFNIGSSPDCEILGCTESAACNYEPLASADDGSCEYAEAVITADGAWLSANEGMNYQWYLDEEEIEGATAQLFEAIVSGSYTVAVTDEDGCTGISDAVLVVGVTDVSDTKISIAPNPMDSYTTLSFGSLTPTSVILINSEGSELRRWDNIVGQNLTIHRKTLASGSYFLKIYREDFQRIIPLVVR